MSKRPKISICIPTFKRRELLSQTIRSVLNQTYKNFEIIVSDNDPHKSSEETVKKLHTKKIRYIAQKRNVGMMRNFGKAFDISTGDFVVFLGDDDPIEPEMLEILVSLYNKFPQAGSYFGAPYLLVKDPEIKNLHGLKGLKTSMRNKKIPKNKIRVYNPPDFLHTFLNYQIFDYFFWSCGMVRRDIVEKVGKAHPLYGSNLLTDYAYILRVGTADSMVTINRELGCQRIHGSNYGRNNEELLTLKPAIRGMYEEMIKKAFEFGCNKDLERFMSNWTKTHLLSILRYRILSDLPQDRLFFLKVYLDIMKDFPFLKRDLIPFYLTSFFPLIYSKYTDYKWIFERRTVKKAFDSYIFRK